MRLASLTSIKSQDLKDLLREERNEWARDLKWDYAEPQRLIAQMIDEGALAGHVVMAGTTPVGYSFYLEQGNVGLVGNCFVAASHAGSGVEWLLLKANIDALKRRPQIHRIESQLVDSRKWRDFDFLPQQGFKPYQRCFLSRSCDPMNRQDLPEGLLLKTWTDADLWTAAALTTQTYQNSVDSKISCHYHTDQACRDFLSGIVFRPGCGHFLPDASFSLWETATSRLAGYVLASTLSPRQGHIPQILVAPQFQGRRLGTILLDRVVREFCNRDYSTVSLSVTALNQQAMSMYHRVGFSLLFNFYAFVWQRNP